MAQHSETVITRVSDSDAPATLAGEGCLVVFYGQNIGRRYFLNRPRLVIGRSDTTQLHIDQESVSRQHAEVLTEGASSSIRDLGSTNGTFVNNVRVTAQPLRDGDLLRVGQTIFKYLGGNNIEGKYHEEIYRLSTIDGLTEAYNKRYFLDALTRELQRAARYGRGLCLVIFDIDHFKRINDGHGHLAGDHVLREMSHLVAQNLRRQDIFARYGGEEFAIVLPEVDKETARLVSEKLRALVEAQAFQFAQKRIPVTVSLGIASFGEGMGDITASDFIAIADGRLYAAKQGGRNRVCD